MSPTLSPDDVFATELRARLDAVAPDLSLDTDATVRSFHRRRTRRTAIGGGAAVAVVVGLGLAAGLLPSLDSPPPPATQEPRTLGEDRAVEVAPGIWAANRPESIEVPGGLESTVEGLDLGIDGFADNGSLPLVMLPAPPAPTNPWVDLNGTQEFDSGVLVREFGAAAGEEIYYGLFVWNRDDAAERYWPHTALAFPVARGVTYEYGGYPNMVAGAVPSWLSQPRVILYSQAGYPLADGTVSHGIELPTFRSPTGDGRLVYAALIAEEYRATPEALPADKDYDLVLFLDAGGEVFMGSQCWPGGVERCIETFGPTLSTLLDLEPSEPAPVVDVEQATRLDPPSASPSMRFALDVGVVASY